ncbi:L-threonylcarbamoyladenylate synthase [Deinococcus rubellus]|uniref:L-threonylcarbamoyladenylate synthase n=1 Tax=Deinococcus rubellus TaxID=1889240 RepID=A0ABY5YEE0_9DEIO|nr:L-threonylcarbamoyladenylate synthase [Deinococcus rubellus]UWX63437.1 L-threonylcarbamoyladenylate synthase [Deinococcus rubellus]
MKHGQTQPQPQWEAALAALTRGRIIGFPTETVWGLGTDAHSPSAVAALSVIKGRPSGKALQVSCADVTQARALAAPQELHFEALAALLPGPLTLVVRAAPTCPAWLVFGGKVGLRVPDHTLTQALLRRWGRPLATTSLNPAGQPSARTLAEARRYGLAEVLLEVPSEDPSNPLAAPEASHLPSTVVDCESGEILRQGALPASIIRAVLAGLP